MLDPKTLLKEPWPSHHPMVIVFGGKAEKIVNSYSLRPKPFGDGIEGEVKFSGGMQLDLEDPLWKIAELKKSELPTLFSGTRTKDMSGKDAYITGKVSCYVSPQLLLAHLKSDVALLEAAGVKPE